MAKKGQSLQLQTEINTADEWKRFLQRDGLLIIDVYSDWCGPCTGMMGTLKKLKLEIGGDLLHLAAAKSDNIEELKRFRNKSEPTWLFVVDGKQVNLMFGANAPKLIKMIAQEINNEKLRREGKFERADVREITDMGEEEKERHQAAQALLREQQEKEDDKKIEDARERKQKECDAILDNLRTIGIIVVYPHAKDRYNEALSELFTEAGLVLAGTEKVTMHPDMLEELFYYDDSVYPDFSYEEHFKKPSLGLILKRSSDTLPTDVIDDIVLQVVYGNKRKYPGDEVYPSRKLTKTSDKGCPIIGIWAPPNANAKAIALKLLFHNLSSPYRLAETPIVPPHVAMAYDAFKSKEILELSGKYPGEVLAYGFFTNHFIGDAQLIAKTPDKFEKKTVPTNYEEKFIIKLSKENSECYEAFKDLGPCYISPSAVEGETDCLYFFPDGYNDVEKAEKEIKKQKKKRKGKPATQADENAAEAQETADEVTVAENQEHDRESEDNLEDSDGEEKKDELVIENEAGTDKATSPMEFD